MYGIDALSNPELIGGPGFDMLGDAVEWAESRGRDNALGPVTRSGERAVGPMQLMRAATIDYLMANGLPADPETVAAMQRDPQKNREIGRWYLRQQYDRFGGDTDKALAAYNWGPARVQKLGDQFSVDRTPAETQKYIQSIRGRLGEQPAPQGEAPMRDDSDPDAALESLMNYQPRQMASQGLAAFAGGQQRPQAPQGQPMQGLDALNPAMQLAGQLMPQRRGMDWTDALMQGGAAMMASRRPDFLGALGEGVGRGHQTFMAGEDQRYKDQVDRMGLGLKLHTAMQKDTSPIKLGEGEQLIDRNTMQPIAGNPKQREPKIETIYEGNDEVQYETLWNGAMMQRREVGRRPRQAEDRSLTQIFDPESPSGTRWVSREEAAGKPGALQSGLSLETDPKTGAIRLVQGPGAGRPTQTDPQTGLSNKVLADLDEKIISMTGQAQQLARMRRQFEPMFQQIGTRFKMAGMEWGEKFGASLDPKAQEDLAKFTSFRSESAQFFADRIKEMSGAAVTDGEAKRQTAYLPTPGTGIWDGDSPTVFSGKLGRLEDFTQDAIARLVYARRAGIEFKNIDDLASKLPIEQMPRIIRERGEVLAGQIRKGRPDIDEAALRDQVKRALAVEFGLFGG